MLQEKQLSAVFQPIIDLRRQAFLGYEGLIRGPDTLSPRALFEAAKHQGQLADLEKPAFALSFSAMPSLAYRANCFSIAAPMFSARSSIRSLPTFCKPTVCLRVLLCLN